MKKYLNEKFKVNINNSLFFLLGCTHSMLDSTNLNKILYNLESADADSVELFEKIIKYGIRFAQNTNELKEELLDFNDTYQFCLIGINYNFWVKISKGSIIYKNGINDEAVAKFILSKNIMLKIIKRELSISEAYMRGHLKIRGNLSSAIKFRNFVMFLFKYLNHYHI